MESWGALQFSLQFSLKGKRAPFGHLRELPDFISKQKNAFAGQTCGKPLSDGPTRPPTASQRLWIRLFSTKYIS